MTDASPLGAPLAARVVIGAEAVQQPTRPGLSARQADTVPCFVPSTTMPPAAATTSGRSWSANSRSRVRVSRSHRRSFRSQPMVARRAPARLSGRIQFGEQNCGAAGRRLRPAATGPNAARRSVRSRTPAPAAAVARPCRCGARISARVRAARSFTMTCGTLGRSRRGDRANGNDAAKSAGIRGRRCGDDADVWIGCRAGGQRGAAGGALSSATTREHSDCGNHGGRDPGLQCHVHEKCGREAPCSPSDKPSLTPCARERCVASCRPRPGTPPTTKSRPRRWGGGSGPARVRIPVHQRCGA